MPDLRRQGSVSTATTRAAESGAGSMSLWLSSASIRFPGPEGIGPTAARGPKSKGGTLGLERGSTPVLVFRTSPSFCGLRSSGCGFPPKISGALGPLIATFRIALGYRLVRNKIAQFHATAELCINEYYCGLPRIDTFFYNLKTGWCLVVFH